MPDSTTVPVRLLPGIDRQPARPDRLQPVFVLVPGLGIPAGYYEPVAAELAGRGFDAAICELRGQGDSRPRPSRHSRYGYQELVSVDFPAMFGAVRDRFPDRTPFLIGHSLGGQLGVLYAARVRGRLGGMVVIAAGIPFHRGYGQRGAGVLVGAAALSATANLVGFWPGDRLDVGGFGRQSRVLVADWARSARTGRLEPTGADIDYGERIARLTLPVLAITLAADELVPPAAVEHLLATLPRAGITRWTPPTAFGHNEWIQRPTDVVDRIIRWLHDAG